MNLFVFFSRPMKSYVSKFTLALQSDFVILQNGITWCIYNKQMTTMMTCSVVDQQTANFSAGVSGAVSHPERVRHLTAAVETFPRQLKEEKFGGRCCIGIE